MSSEHQKIHQFVSHISVTSNLVILHSLASFYSYLLSWTQRLHA